MAQSRVHKENSKEFKALTKVVERFEIASSADRDIKEKHLDFYKLYRGYRKHREGRSNIFVPMIYALVETIEPRIIKGMFEKRPYVSVLPRDPQSEASAEANERLLDYQFNHSHVRMVEKTMDWVKQFIQYGVGVAKTYWDLEEKTIIRKTSVARNTISGEEHIVEDVRGSDLLDRIEFAPEYEINREEIEEEVTVYEGPNFEACDVGDIFVAPNASSAKDAPYVIHRYHLSLDDLKQGQEEERFKNVHAFIKARKEAGGSTPMGDDLAVDERKGSLGHVVGGQKEDPHDDLVEILEYWEDNEVIIVADRDVVIQGPEENPYWHKMKPFISVHNTRLMGEFWSIGDIEPNVSMQKEINTRRNQRIDNINLSLTKAWFVLNNVNVDKAKLANIKPGDTIRVSGVNRIEDGIQEFSISDVTASSYQEEQVAKEDMRMTSGIYDWYSGKQPTQQQTATTVTAIIGEAHVRVEMKIYKFATEGLAELAQHFIQLNQQFMEEDQLIRVMGEKGAYEFHNILPEEIAGFFDLMPACTGTDPLANNELKQQQALQLYSMMSQNPIIDQVKLAVLVLKQFDEVDNPEEFIAQQPPMAPDEAGMGQPQGPMAPPGQAEGGEG